MAGFWNEHWRTVPGFPDWEASNFGGLRKIVSEQQYQLQLCPPQRPNQRKAKPDEYRND